MQKDIAAARAERFANADFAGAFGDADQHDVHDDDAADDQRDGSDGDGDDERKTELMSFHKREERIAGFDGEIVFGAVFEMMAAAHDLADFVHGVLNFVGRSRRER